MEQVNNDNNSNYLNNDINDDSNNHLQLTSSFSNPLAEPLSFWYQFYKRFKLFPWWIRYNIGVAKEAIIKDKIIELGTEMGLQDKWLDRIVRHAVSEFSKKGLGSDYYGYHNIDHELEAAYFTLLAADGQNKKQQEKLELVGENSEFSQEDIKYLFVAALFHDYDPLKQSDKPREDAIEGFIRNDCKIRKFIDAVGININIVIAIIHRTAYPFKGKTAQYAEKRMQQLFEYAGIDKKDTKTRKHYNDLGWFLSISERIAGYSLGGLEHSMELARTNAHALGWHPSRIHEESVKYFSMLKEEKEMFEKVLYSIPDQYQKNFFENTAAFKEAWVNEIYIRNSIRRNKIILTPVVEKKRVDNNKYVLDTNIQEAIFNLHRELHPPIGIKNEQRFKKSLNHKDTILITLRAKDHDRDEQIVGYVKGGQLETYQLRRGTHDDNFGKRNTAYMEWISIKPGFWGETGGHILRIEFLKESKRRGYTYVSSYVHRNVLQHRIERGENIEVVQRYDPDKLDYYRVDLTSLDSSVSFSMSMPLVLSESIQSTESNKEDDVQIDKNYPIVD
ncbi:MAG: hypothetical protein M3247_01350 [Thermoproteota archaeon]|nr:hypothetical protein [Thermoproteota archaeon]